MGLPEILIYEELESTQDEAFTLARQNRLAVWGSALAIKQTQGRGQGRKEWQSLPGNLMVSLRLPPTPPFTEQASAIATAALVGSALNNMGYEARLKWPNDLGGLTGNDFCKFAGILVEEKNGLSVAGIGINLGASPDNRFLAATGGQAACALTGGNILEPAAFWEKLLRHMLEVWIAPAAFQKNWNRLANALLIWKGEKITFDGSHEGVVKQIAPDGSLMVATESGSTSITSGQIRLAGRKGEN